ncbi:uroporphyrin-III C-methyltransferase [Catenovulum agarivorans DS-2]|uniref:Uroporphyrin-III C-methyltransferase n=1 Tax=Catenovulum agarivorans DS-2 TaxID=1328313 RepID=W7QR39_9ALTE|nr:uroporphyrinogen-III C-methyltransferase [Catenovulum agarivorans]EWH10333.1 uroporphyrin-III C-methyltransferase [Catenovulum agarivorans DS-2]
MTDKTESATNQSEPTTAAEHNNLPTEQSANRPDQHPEASSVESEQKPSKPAAEKDKSEVAAVTEQATKSSGKGIALLSLLIALAAVGASGYLYWQAQYKPQNWLSQLNQVEQNLEQMSSQQQGLNQLAEQIRQQAQNQQQQFEQNLQQDLQQYANDLAQAQQQTYANQQAELSNLLNQVKQNSQNNKNKLLLNDVNYLIKQAQYKLVLEKNPTAALLAMQLAADTLKQADLPQYIELSSAINQDIGLLTELASQQNQDVYLALAQIIGQVRLLPMQQTELTKKQPNTAENKPSTETSWQNLVIVWRDFLQLFTPKKRNASVEALLTPEQSQNIELNLVSVLHQAQWAALNKNPEVLSAALKQAANWLSIYYQTNDIRVMDSIDKLIELSELDITGNFATVELSSLDLLGPHHD